MLLCSLTSRTTPHLTPSTPYPTRAMIPPLITWPHRLELEKNLKTPSVSLVRAWRKKQKGSILPLPLPSHLFSLSKPISSLSWKWLLMFDTKYPSGKRNKRRKKFWEKKVVLLACQCRDSKYSVSTRCWQYHNYQGGVREMSLRTETILPGVRKGNFVTWSAGCRSYLYSSRKPANVNVQKHA